MVRGRLSTLLSGWGHCRPKAEEVTWERKSKLHYFLHTVGLNKSGKILWASHVARIVSIGNSYEFDIKQVVCKSADWIHLARDRFEWLAGVNTATNLPVHTWGTVPWLRRLVAGIQRRPGLDPGEVYVGFVVDKVTLWQVFLWVLRFPPFSIIPPTMYKLNIW
jgi:hypothetical protein